MSAKISMVDLEQQTQALWPELEKAVLGVLRSGRVILGPNVFDLQSPIELPNTPSASLCVDVTSIVCPANGRRRTSADDAWKLNGVGG